MVLRLHSVAAMEVFVAEINVALFGEMEPEVNPMDARLLYPVAVTLLPDAAKVVFARVTLEVSWLKDANPIDATASPPEADTRHPTHVREVSVAVMVELARYVAKPILATPFNPRAVTLHLNAVSEVFVVEITDIPAKDALEETMPMDAMTWNPANS